MTDNQYCVAMSGRKILVTLALLERSDATFAVHAGATGDIYINNEGEGDGYKKETYTVSSSSSVWFLIRLYIIGRVQISPPTSNAQVEAKMFINLILEKHQLTGLWYKRLAN